MCVYALLEGLLVISITWFNPMQRKWANDQISQIPPTPYTEWWEKGFPSGLRAQWRQYDSLQHCIPLLLRDPTPQPALA